MHSATDEREIRPRELLGGHSATAGRWLLVMTAALLVGCDAAPAPTLAPASPASPALPARVGTLEPTVTSGPQVLDCAFLLSPTEVERLIAARVEQVLVSYGDGAGCQYQTARGAAYITTFTGPVAEKMWSNRPIGTPGPPGPAGVEMNIVDGAPVAHLPGRWVTVSGEAFDRLPLETRIELVTLLASRL